MKKYIVLILLFFGTSLYAQVFNPAQQKYLDDSLATKSKVSADSVIFADRIDDNDEDITTINNKMLADSITFADRIEDNDEAIDIVDSKRQADSIAFLDRILADSTNLEDLEARYIADSTAKASTISTLTRDSIKTHSFFVLNPQEDEEFAMFYAFDDYLIHSVSGNVVGGDVTINIYFDETCYDPSPVSGIWDQGNKEITTSTSNPLSGIGTALSVSSGRWVWVKIIELPEVAATELQLTIKYSAQ